MRLIFLLTILSFGGVSLADPGGAGVHVGRYSVDEIDKIYQSSKMHYMQGDYRRAIISLSHIEGYQNSLVKNHMGAIKILLYWDVHNLDAHLSDLMSLGINRGDLYRGVCDYILKKRRYKWYAYCARALDDFVILVDQQIASMLDDYYSASSRPFHRFQYLKQLVNRNELSGNYERDSELIRNRIKAILEDEDCADKSAFCELSKSSVTEVVKRFVYGGN